MLHGRVPVAMFYTFEGGNFMGDEKTTAQAAATEAARRD